jgi:transposase InsO family protein
MIWGVDIVGILARAPGGFRFLFISIDTFTKWMEVISVVNITQEAAIKVLKSIIYRFGVSKRVITDNGTQFKGAKFLKCCADFGIHHQPSSAAHLQTNRQVECINGLLLQGIKTRMLQDLEQKARIGTRSCPQFYGPYGPISIGPPEVRPLVWYMEQKRYCYLKSILNRLGWCIFIQKIMPKQESLT